MYFKPSAYRSIIIDNFKPEYEKMKKDCKHKIMISGKSHKIIVVMKQPEMIVNNETNHMINIGIELMLVETQGCHQNELTHTIYEPDYYQIKKWSASPEARKAKIKDIFK